MPSSQSPNHADQARERWLVRSRAAYDDNGYQFRDRRLSLADSPWVRSFACDDMRVLIVCRGPIRKEAIDVFREMGMTHVGMLLSEKDSIVYPRALAPEVRIMDPDHVHAVPDYSGATREERQTRVQQIIQICRDHGYQYVFAGYGFMAEDAELVRALEQADLRFIGPCSYTQTAAGAKDEAKRTAIENDVSVTPGINDATVRTLLRKHPQRQALVKLARELELDVPRAGDATLSLPALAEQLLEASYKKQVDLFSIEELAGDAADRGRAPAAGTAGPALPAQGDRRRRRQGPAHLRRSGSGTGAGARGARRGQGDRPSATTRTC